MRLTVFNFFSFYREPTDRIVTAMLNRSLLSSKPKHVGKYSANTLANASEKGSHRFRHISNESNDGSHNSADPLNDGTQHLYRASNSVTNGSANGNQNVFVHSLDAPNNGLNNMVLDGPADGYPDVSMGRQEPCYSAHY